MSGYDSSDSSREGSVTPVQKVPADDEDVRVLRSWRGNLARYSASVERLEGLLEDVRSQHRLYFELR